MKKEVFEPKKTQLVIDMYQTSPDNVEVNIGGSDVITTVELFNAADSLLNVLQSQANISRDKILKVMKKFG